MKGMLFLVVCSFLTGHLPAQQTIIHDPHAELRQVDSFHAIEVSGGIDLYLSQGDREAVAVSAKDISWRDRIHTIVENGVLKIRLDRKRNFSWGRNNLRLKAYIAFTGLSGLSASGASDIYVDGVIAGRGLVIDLSGASDFKGAVRVSELTLDQSGASDIVITGTVSGLTSIRASGASAIKGYDLSTDNCVVRASGASGIQITVNKELSVHVSGASSVDYSGNAVMREIHSSGASRVSKKGL